MDELDPRAEWEVLVEAARALLELHELSGTVGLPPGSAVASASSVARAGAAASPLREERPARVEPRLAPSRPEPSRAEPSRAEPSRPEPSRAEPSQPEPRPPAPLRPAPAPQPRGARPAVPASLSPDERRARLTVLADEVRGCTACGLHEGRTHTVFSRGDPLARLCFVGEGPGEQEDLSGLPFVGPAGELLDRMIGAMGLSPDAVYVCNIVKCRPPGNRTPERDEMAACMPFLHEQLALARPEIIVALGATALRGLCGVTQGITAARGSWRAYKHIPVMPTFHPSYLLRDPHNRERRGQVWDDLKQVLGRLGLAVPAPARGGGTPSRT